ncbi:MAG: SDR family NAD(P)-dependent oxidoreductase [Pseudomonadota bacterium]
MERFNGMRDLEDGGRLVAVVGMACRLPGGNRTPDEYWSFLLDKGCGIREVPEDRWAIHAFYDENADAMGKSASKWGGFLDDVRGFDAAFFGISPREADAMDPQQRLLLQTAYEAIQDSVAPLEDYQAANTGVFVGVSQSDYRAIQELRPTNPEAFAGTGYALCINANRISHRLNLSGPSFAVDTACSSSLVALNEAVQSLASGGCDRAIVGGVNVLAHPSSFIAFSRAGMLSTTGQVSTFDTRANGFVRGEGAGVVVLKPYDAALRDGDPIHAVIHATNCNQDGRTSTITAPSQCAQIDVLEGLFGSTSLRPDQVGYVEAHGTGTPVGDPIEAGAIGRVIGQSAGHGPVFVGSGKANVGHGEPAAGITGFIKAVLSVRNKTVAPNINFAEANPSIPFDALNLRVPTKAEPFPEVDGLRVAVVNSFGFGGTNASVLLSSTPEEPEIRRAFPVHAVAAEGLNTDHWPYFFLLSAGTPEGVCLQAANLLAALKDKAQLKDAPLSKLAANLAGSQSHRAHRAVVLAGNRKDLLSALDDLAQGEADVIDANPNIRRGQVSDTGKLCFMFAGQGSQWWAMARHFMEDEPIFAAAVDAFDTHFVQAAGWSIKEELLRDEATSRMDDTTVTQPALFAIQAGLAALWKHVGVTPDMVVGHSIGEAAAAYVADGLSLDGAARFLSKRGEIRDRVGAKGAMAAVGMPLEDVTALLPDHGLIGIAAVNGPGSVTISGDFDAIHDFVEEFTFAHPDTFIRILKVDTAWHSYQLEAGEAWFRQEVRHIDWTAPRIPFISTVTGQPETRFDIDYAWQNLRQPVMFQAGIEAALGLGAGTFVELGPHTTLAGPTTATTLEKGARARVLNSLSRKAGDFETFARTMADLFVAGQDLNWPAITGGVDKSIPMPKIAWAQVPHWSESEEVQRYLKAEPAHLFLGHRRNQSGVAYSSEFNTKTHPFLKDHRLQADTIFPGAGFVDMILRMGRDRHGDKPLEVENARILDALFLPDEADVFLSGTFDEGRQIARLHSRVRGEGDEWTERSTGVLRATDVPAPKAPVFKRDAKGVEEIPVSCVYDVDKSLPFVNYGPAFQVVEKLWMSRNAVFAKLTAPDEIMGHFDRFEAHPALLDGCLQLCDPRMTQARIRTPRAPGDPIFLPIGARRMRFYHRFPREIFVHARHSYDEARQVGEASFVVTDAAGTVLATAEGLEMKALPTKPVEEVETGPQPQFARQKLVPLREPFAVDTTPAIATKPWVVIGQKGPQTDAVLKSLTDKGVEARLLDRAEMRGAVSDSLDAALAAQMEAGAIGGILYTGALDPAPADPSGTAEAMFDPVNRITCDLVALGEFLEFYRNSEAGLARLVVLTSGAYPDAGDWATTRALTQSPVLAVTRVLLSELPEYDIRHADLAPDGDMAAVADYALADTNEAEAVFAPDGVLVPRLQKLDTDTLDPRLLTVDAATDTTNFHATMRKPGAIDALDLWQLPNEPLGADQVRVRVAAVGLNFRDIMAVTGLLPEEAEPDPAWQHLGLEFGGVVEDVGDNVTGFKPGDRVMGMQRRCLQRFMVLDPIALTPVPDHISLEEAATIPSAFATAHYALNHVGRMGQGDRVFIHVATGGVGTAAVQLAQAAGAEIFATAGNPKKRKLLKDQGVHHVMDSRSLKFADDVTRITKGAGVDVLLNSLPGDYITKGLDIMAPYGRFLEIGKRDVYADSAVGMKALRKNVTLAVLDLAAMGQERPKLLAGLMAELAEKFADKALTPLPLTTFPISQVADAVRYMSQAKHVGKVVVTLDDPTFRIRRDVSQPVALKSDASYLVTGGTGGFGLTIADWLSRKGAGKLYLASRSGAVGKGDQKRLAKIEKRGTVVEAVSLDVTEANAVEAFVAGAAKGEFPLRGAVHAAAVIKDGFVTQLTPQMISDVLRPKLVGGWAIHQAFEKAGIRADMMVGFSSIAQMIGSGGQANYVAANAFLEALAAHRRADGQAGSAINWGVIGGSGFVARNEGLAGYLEFVGLAGLTDTDAGMEIALSRDIGQFTYANVDWAQLGQANRALGRTARFASLLQKDSGDNGEVRARLMALSGDAMVQAAKDFILEEVSAVLKVDASAIQTDRPMSELGLDSLSSFELKMRVESALDLMLPVSKFLQAPSIDELAALLCEEVTKMAATEAATADASEADTGGPQKATAAHLASTAQSGMIALAKAPMSSPQMKAALEHRATLRLPKGMVRDDLQKILRKLARRHPMLTASVQPEGGRDVLVFEAKPKVTMGDGTPPLDVAHGEWMRTSVAKGRVTLQLHHVLADAASMDVLVADLKALFDGKDLPKSARARVVKSLPGALAFDPETPQGHADQAFFYYTLADGADPLPFTRRARPALPLSVGQDHGPAGTLTGTCTKASEAQHMQAFAQALRAATNTTGNVLMARLTKPAHLLPKAPAVGPFSLRQPVLVPDRNDPKAARNLQRALDHGPKHTSFDVFAAAETFANWFDTWQVSPLQIGFEAAPAAHLKRLVTGTAHDVLLQVSKSSYRIIFDTDVLADDQARALAQAYEAALKSTDREDVPHT